MKFSLCLLFLTVGLLVVPGARWDESHGRTPRAQTAGDVGQSIHVASGGPATRSLVGASPYARPAGLEARPGKSHNFVGQEVAHFLNGLLALSNDFFSEGDKVFGPGEVVTVSGVVPFLPYCRGMAVSNKGRGEGLFDFFPVADLYVIRDTGQYLPWFETLKDESGAANRVFGTGSGPFVDAVVAIAQPAGSLPAGRYDIVMDQCLDGVYDPGIDLVLGAGPAHAFEILIPGPLPKMNLNPLKLQASIYSKYWAGDTITLPGVDPIVEPIEIEIPGYCATFAKLIEKAKLEPLDPVGAAAKIAVLQCDNVSKHWDGIAHDPPDPNFMEFAELGDRGYDFRPLTTPLGRAMRALAHVMADHAAQSRALLTTLERFQGAQQAGNDEYAVLQLEEANKLVTLQIGPGGSLLRLYAALEAFDAALQNDPIGALPEAQQLRAFIPEIRRGIGGLVHVLGPDFERVKTQSQDTIVPRGFQAWLIVYLGLEPLLANENLPGILQVRTAAGLPPIVFQHPTAQSTGAYVAAPRAHVLLDARGSTDPNGDALSFSWDLDGDGAFDDAVGATADIWFAEPGTRLLGVKVSDAAGHSDVHYPLVKIGDVSSQDVVAAGSKEGLYRIRPDGAVDVLRPTPGGFVQLNALHVDVNGDFFVLTGRANTDPFTLQRYGVDGQLKDRVTMSQIAALIGVPLRSVWDFVLDARGDVLLTATENIPGPVRTFGPGLNGTAPNAEGRGLLIRMAKDASRASVIAYVHQEYVTREIIDGEVVLSYAHAHNGAKEPALAILPDGGIVVAPANNRDTDRVDGIFRYDPDSGAATTIIPGNRISGFAIVEIYVPVFGAGSLFCGSVTAARGENGLEVDGRGNLITGHGTGPCPGHLYRMLMPPQLSTLAFPEHHGVEVFPLITDTIFTHDSALDRGGDALVAAYSSGVLPAGIYRVSPSAEIFPYAAIPEGISVLDVVPEVRTVTAKDIPPTPRAGLTNFSVLQGSCPDAAQLKVSVVNRGGATLEPGARVYFYEGDPQADGQLVAFAITTAAIPAGSSQDVTASWRSPAPGAHEVYAVTMGADAVVGRSGYLCIPEPANGRDAVVLEPRAASATLGTAHTVTASLRDVLGRPMGSVPVTFAVTGTNTASGLKLTDANGLARFSYTGVNKGRDTIAATVPNGGTSNAAAVDWLVAPDTTAPTLALPAGITAEATGPLGATVTFEATATDLVDGGVPVLCDAASPSLFAIGATTVGCSAVDRAGNTATGRFVVTVGDKTPPTIVLIGPNPMTIERLSRFIDPGATAFDTVAGSLTGAIHVTGAVDSTTVGTYELSYSVTDGVNRSEVRRTVRVVDNAPPRPSAPELEASPGTLWPPNHKMVPVSIVPTGRDAHGLPFTCRITSIASSEPENGLGDGDSAPDWTVTGDLTATLRAERFGTGPGRTYTITALCTDSSKNVFAAKVTIGVEHNR